MEKGRGGGMEGGRKEGRDGGGTEEGMEKGGVEGWMEGGREGGREGREVRVFVILLSHTPTRVHLESGCHAYSLSLTSTSLSSFRMIRLMLSLSWEPSLPYRCSMAE